MAPSIEQILCAAVVRTTRPALASALGPSLLFFRIEKNKID